MRLAYTADLHGDIESYQSLLELAVASGARAAIVGGDLLPHSFKVAEALASQREFIQTQLRPLLETFRTAHPDIDVYLLPGNDDWFAAIAELAVLERTWLAYPLHQHVYPLRPIGGEPEANVWLAGYACVPLTPFSIKDYERRDQGPMSAFSFAMAYVSWEGSIRPVKAHEIARLPSIADDLADLARRSDPARTVYVCHTPPFDTALDQMPRNRHAGSRAVRKLIEQHGPLLTLHGHIHESPDMSGQFAVQIGNTWSVNPGRDPVRFHAVTVDTDDIAGTLTHTVYGSLA